MTQANKLTSRTYGNGGVRAERAVRRKQSNLHQQADEDGGEAVVADGEAANRAEHDGGNGFGGGSLGVDVFDDVNGGEVVLEASLHGALNAIIRESVCKGASGQRTAWMTETSMP